MKDFSTFIGMDVHKETIAVGIAGEEGFARYYGEIMNTPAAIAKLVKKAGERATTATSYQIINVSLIYIDERLLKRSTGL